MHDVGMNMSQLAMSVKQVDDTIELAHEWSHQLLLSLIHISSASSARD